jgi:hypothetical protein
VRVAVAASAARVSAIFWRIERPPVVRFVESTIAPPDENRLGVG